MPDERPRLESKRVTPRHARLEPLIRQRVGGVAVRTLRRGTRLMPHPCEVITYPEDEPRA